jgi:hypothetical protein
MIGLEIKEIAKLMPDSYRRLAINGRGDTAMYYAEDDRHAIYVRHGVVFSELANVTEQEAFEAWDGWLDRLSRPKQEAPKQPASGAVDSDAVLAERATSMYVALGMIHSAAHNEKGEMLKSIRPVGLKEAITWAMETYLERRGDLRATLRDKKIIDMDASDIKIGCPGNEVMVIAGDGATRNGDKPSDSWSSRGKARQGYE